jgi:hypothetical protein
MGKPKWLEIAAAICCLVACAGSVEAQKLDATVLYRQSSDSGYSALIPGYSAPGTPDCAADVANAECFRPTHIYEAGPGAVSYNVVGTTLSLLLPDGKIAVVNCINKSKYSSRGAYIVLRNCGMPMVEHVEAELKGDMATLEWPVTPDSKKTESEKYRIVAVLDKR